MTGDFNTNTAAAIGHAHVRKTSMTDANVDYNEVGFLSPSFCTLGNALGLFGRHYLFAADIS